MRSLRWGVLGFLALLLSWHVDTWHTPNPTSRALLTIALVEDRAYSIDRFRDWTEDKAFVRGHYYSDKAPLASWITAPLYATVHALQGNPRSPYPSYWALGSGAVASGILPALFFAAILWGALRVGRASLPLSVLYLVCALPCSLLGIYSGTFFGHVLSGLLLVLAWRAVFDAPSAVRAGLHTGLAALAEFPLLLFAPFLLLGCLRQAPAGRRADSVLRFGLGLLPGLLLIGLHNRLTTGNALEFAYKHVASDSFAHMRHLYGFSLPSLTALGELLLSPARGLAIYLPLAAVLIFFGLRRGGAWRTLPGLRAISLFSFLLLVSSYRMWEGGWSFGPRHLIPAAMVLLYEGARLVPSRASRAWTGALALAAALGGVQVFAAKATRLYMVPPDLGFPLGELFIPKLLAGELNRNVLPTFLWNAPPLASHLLWAALLISGTLYLSRTAAMIGVPLAESPAADTPGTAPGPQTPQPSPAAPGA